MVENGEKEIEKTAFNMRKTKFQNENFYHIFNRGVDKRVVFCDEKDYLRFLESMKNFNQIKPIGSLYQCHKRNEKVLFLIFGRL